MTQYRELSYDRDIDAVRGLQFCIQGPDEIKRRSVVEVVRSELFAGTDPIPFGLFDSRMGVVDHNRYCATCSQRSNFCPGHFGHIALARPVFLIQYFEIVRKLLRCVCFRCSRLLVDVERPDFKPLMSRKCSRQRRWEAMTKLAQKVDVCGKDGHHGCGARQPSKIVKAGPVLTIQMEWKKGDVGDEEARVQTYSAADVLEILRRVTDADAEALGLSPKYNHPSWMIATNMPVPPPCVRPSVRNEAGQRSEDDLTHKLVDIVKANNLLKQRLERGSSKEVIDNTTQLLQYHVITLIDNQLSFVSPAMQRTGRMLKSLTERLKSKEGRIRGNLCGKRCDFSSRTVITPDPNISIDELGVPYRIAMNLTFPEIVTKHNMARMLQLVRNGPFVYPGAKVVQKTREAKGPRTILLRRADLERVELEEGDIVERHLLEGDIGLFNRQPSLHRMSMMAHRIRVMPYNTFRLNVLVTKPFNADYDGDEMNLHIPQSYITSMELKYLAAVPTQVITPRECKPIVSVVQDVALGLYRITQRDVRVTEKQLWNILSTNELFDGRPPVPRLGDDKRRLFSGHEILSTFFPRGISTTSTTGDDKIPELDRTVVIRDGDLMQGVISADTYQRQTHGLVHHIYNELGQEATRHFFDNTQKTICAWMLNSGFSVGISDMVIDADTAKRVAETIHDMKVKVYDVLDTIHEGRFENKTIEKNSEAFEELVNGILNGARSDAVKIGLATVDEKSNRLMNMVNAKSKGNTVNVAQIMACVGQVNVEGKRVPYGFDGRTLPHYTKYDDGPESRGFVENSFINGLTPAEFFFHSMGGREGLIDTAVKTSSTGYLQRKLCKAMEDHKIGHDLSVRNVSGQIIQFLYGEDGMDPIRVEKQGLPYMKMDTAKMRKEYLFTPFDPLESFMTPDAYEALVADHPDWLERAKAHFEQLLQDREFIIDKIFNGGDCNAFIGRAAHTLQYPVAVERIVHDAAVIVNKAGRLISDLSPVHVLDTIDRLAKELKPTPKGVHGGCFMAILLRLHLSPKTLIYKHRMSKAVFDLIAQKIRHRFYDALANPSDMVGIIAAQSIGEPLSQLTLNTFHSVK
jgi:DNA-directed RNA polymerase II subunit RPB1